MVTEKGIKRRDEQVNEIERLLRRISAIIKQKGREILSDFPITPPQFVALQWLMEEGDMTIGELSNKMFLACSTTTDLVDRMENNQLVKRVKDTKDRRVVRIHLLEKGEEIIYDVLKARQKYLREVLGHLTEEDVESIEKVLTMLYREMENEIPYKGE
ncbi:MarR family transcriptional regulator [Microaerobacter geothermalis]|uniref:MarR family winged helix-turn-helix transcriptional regulator n=1 Tax=Microaerobacter geothermalis TaxID=674972 RepID=UPI001F2C1FB7|nr:MarR family transcriptional regulator [Microaerobacter geothermalis]MCF6092627.1 MarR family transcriptional regulator [Microaerobacter geothermalis]